MDTGVCRSTESDMTSSTPGLPDHHSYERPVPLAEQAAAARAEEDAVAMATARAAAEAPVRSTLALQHVGRSRSVEEELLGPYIEMPPTKTPRRRSAGILIGKTVMVVLTRDGRAQFPFGFTITTDKKRLIAEKVSRSGKAFKRGLRDGYTLVKINGVPCKDMSQFEAQRKIQDEPNTLCVEFKEPSWAKKLLRPRKAEPAPVPAHHPEASAATGRKKSLPVLPLPAPMLLTLWYAPNYDGRRAKLRLQGEEDGSFLVRLSGSQQDKFTLSFKQDCVKHVRIGKTETPPYRFFLDERHPFDSIPQLISHYYEQPLSDTRRHTLHFTLKHGCGTQEFPEPWSMPEGPRPQWQYAKSQNRDRPDGIDAAGRAASEDEAEQGDDFVDAVEVFDGTGEGEGEGEEEPDPVPEEQSTLAWLASFVIGPATAASSTA